MIKYKEGDILGPYNILFKKEVDKYISPKGKTCRKGIFVCPFCGKDFITTLPQITTGRCKSCGCQKNKPKLDLLGQRFGKLTVLCRSQRYEKGRSLF